MIFEPRDQDQIEGIRFMVKHSYGGLFWDPGTGKTPVTLQAFKILRDRGIVERMLVVASINVMNDVWPEQIEKFDDLDLTYSIVHGSAKKREQAFEEDADVYLINYEGVRWLWETYGSRHGIDMLVIDEASKYRNRGARTLFGVLRKLLKTFKRRYILTGTPAPKSYLNLWPQMYIVDRGETLGTTLGGFRNRFFTPGGFKGYEWKLRDGADEEIQQLIAPRIHRAERKNKVGIKFIDLPVRLPPKAMAAYRELEREFITEWRGKTLLASNAAVATTKLRQAANGAVYHGAAPGRKGARKKREFVVLHERKAEALYELADDLNERGQSLLTAYEFSSDYAMMKLAGIEAPSYSEARAGKQRTELKNAWNRGELQHLTGQIGAMSHGLNVQYGGWNGAYYGLLYDLDQYEQFYQRLWRSDQNHEVHMYRLIAEGTIDEVELEVLHSREQQQRGLLDGVKAQNDLLKALRKRYKLGK